MQNKVHELEFYSSKFYIPASKLLVFCYDTSYFGASFKLSSKDAS